MPSFIKCVQWWLFLSKLWLVVCSQVNGISHCGSSLLCSAFLDWPPTSLCNINFCVENILVLFTEASSTTRHSTSLLWLSQVSSPSSITVIYMPRSWKPVLFENNWPMSSRWSSQPVFVTPYHCPTHPRLTLNGYQTHLTPKPSTDFVKTLPKHVSGEVIASSPPEWVPWARGSLSLQPGGFEGWSVLAATWQSNFRAACAPSRPERFLLPHGQRCCQSNMLCYMPRNKMFPGRNKVKRLNRVPRHGASPTSGWDFSGKLGPHPPQPLAGQTPAPVAAHCGHFLLLYSKPPASKWHTRRHIC